MNLEKMDSDHILNKSIVNYSTASTGMTYIFSPTYCKHKPNERHQLGDVLDFKIVKETDNKLLLPQYSEGRSSEYGVKMEELNLLQCDLEKLLSTCIVRKCALLSSLNIREEDKGILKNPRCEYCEKHCFLKKPLKETTLHTNMGNQNFCNAKYNIPSSSRYPPRTPCITAVNFLNNDPTNDFWLYTEPYFGHITENDLAFIDELIQESREDIDLRKTEMNKNMYKRCPWFQQPTNSTHFPQMEKINAEMEFKRKMQVAPEHDQISLEIEKCLTELANISKSNVTELLKLRAQVAQHLYS